MSNISSSSQASFITLGWYSTRASGNTLNAPPGNLSADVGLRIVSFLPSATEIIFALGLGAELVGVSHECDFPEAAKFKRRMIEPAFDTRLLESERIDRLVNEYVARGERLYKIRLDEFREANPDVVITQELCDVCAIGTDDVLEAVNQLGKPVTVVSLDPHSLNDIKDDIRNVAKAVGHPEKAEQIVVELQAKAEGIRKQTENAQKSRVFCAEWLRPIMNAGHWVPEMVECAGGIDSLAVRGKPSRYIEWSSVAKYDPEVIVLMPCGLTTDRTLEQAKHFFELPGVQDLSAVRGQRVYATDGHNYFSRSGPRIFEGIKILAQMIHPELFPGRLDPQLGTRVGVMQANA